MTLEFRTDIRLKTYPVPSCCREAVMQCTLPYSGWEAAACSRDNSAWSTSACKHVSKTHTTGGWRGGQAISVIHYKPKEMHNCSMSPGGHEAAAARALTIRY